MRTADGRVLVGTSLHCRLITRLTPVFRSHLHQGVASYLASLFVQLETGTSLFQSLEQLFVEELPQSQNTTLFLETLAKGWKDPSLETLFVFFDLCTSSTRLMEPSLLDAPDGDYEHIAQLMRPFFAAKYTPSANLLHSVLFLLHNKIEHHESLLREMALLSWLLSGDATFITAESVEMFCQLGRDMATIPQYSVYSTFFSSVIADSLPALPSLPASVSLHHMSQP